MILKNRKARKNPVDKKYIENRDGKIYRKIKA